MEEEKKRKRTADHGCGGERRRERRKDVKDEFAVTAAAQPSEAEVEEFFTILRRMHEAVKYFKKTGTDITNIHGVNSSGGKMTELRAHGVKIGGGRDLNCGGLDLNAVPEAEP